jgi:phage-related protein
VDHFPSGVLDHFPRGAPMQRGERLGLPGSRPMPVIGRRCHELRITDADQTWRIVYRTDADAVIIAEVFSKKTRATPSEVIDVCRTRLRKYDDATKELT